MTFDPSKVTEVSATRKTNHPYDLHYREKNGKFRLSEQALIRLNIQENGLRIAKYVDGSIILKLVPEDIASVYARRQGVETKTKWFSSQALRQYLDEKHKDVNNFELDYQATDEAGHSYFIVRPYVDGGLDDFILPGVDPVSPQDEVPFDIPPEEESEEMVVETTTKVEHVVDEDDAEDSAVVEGAAADKAAAPVNEEVEQVQSVEDMPEDADVEYSDETREIAQEAAPEASETVEGNTSDDSAPVDTEQQDEEEDKEAVTEEAEKEPAHPLAGLDFSE